MEAQEIVKQEKEVDQEKQNKAAARKRAAANKKTEAKIEEMLRAFKQNGIDRLNRNIGNTLTDETATGLYHCTIAPVDSLYEEIKKCLQSLSE